MANFDQGTNIFLINTFKCILDFLLEWMHTRCQRAISGEIGGMRKCSHIYLFQVSFPRNNFVSHNENTNICLEREDFAHSRTILQVYFWYCNGNSLTNELFTLVTNEVKIGKKKKT
jgi:hypothetical protein